MNQRIMNQVSIFDKPADNNSVTMTSLELVEFINAHEGRGDLTHANFMAKVPKVLGEGGLIQIQDTYRHPQNGQIYPCYRFPKREACLMAMSYSYELQAKVFDRMSALEAKAAAPALPDFTNPAAAARAWADAIELATAKTVESAQQQAKLSIAEPKADALDRISTASKGSMCITNAAKALQMQPKRLFAWLQVNRWIYLRVIGSGWVGYQDRINHGFVEHKLTPSHRTSEYYLQVLVTAKGLAKLAVDFGKPLEDA